MRPPAPAGEDDPDPMVASLHEVGGDPDDEFAHLLTENYQYPRSPFVETEAKAPQQFGSAGPKIRQAATQIKDASSERYRAMVEAVDESVHKNPWPYIGGVAVGALLLGFILGRKSS